MSAVSRKLTTKTSRAPFSHPRQAMRRANPLHLTKAIYAMTFIALALLGGASCSDDESESNTPVVREPVGQRTFVVTDELRERELRLEVWYPTSETEVSGEAIEAMSPPGGQSLMESALASAPAECVTRETNAGRDAALAEIAGAPLIVFSHCLGCMRFSSFSLAEALAGSGYIVVAVDHAGDTFFDQNEENTLNATTLEMRVADIRFIVDVMLGEVESDVSAELLAAIDTDKIGLFGHSFGSVTSGTVAQRDERIDAVAGIAAPFNFLSTAAPGAFTQPVLQFIADEDNSITFVGNTLIANEHRSLTVPSALVRLEDAGHWSVSDIAGLSEMFMPGCGEDTRQQGGGTVTYPPAEGVLELTSTALVAFFNATLLNDSDDLGEIEDRLAGRDGISEVSLRNQP